MVEAYTPKLYQTAHVKKKGVLFATDDCNVWSAIIPSNFQVLEFITQCLNIAI